MILVTGGTGLVGSHLLISLTETNDSVRAIYRKNSDLNAVKRIFDYGAKSPSKQFLKIEWVTANLNDISALGAAFEGVHKVYHCAAFIDFDPNNYYKLKKTNVEGTANVVNFCLANAVEKLCYVSTIAVLGTQTSTKEYSEKTNWNPEAKNSVYAITKYGAEMEVWRGSQEGLDVVVVQPGVILGEGFYNSGSGEIVKLAAKGMSFYTSGSIGVVDVKDVVNIMKQLMTGTFTNEAYLLVNENITYRNLGTKLALRFNKKPPKFPIAKWVLMFLSKIESLVSFLFGVKRKFPKALVDSMYESPRYTNTKVKRDLELSFTPLDQTIERIAKHYSMES